LPTRRGDSRSYHANLGRATFYAHYHDKHDLLIDTFAGLRQVFDMQQESAGNAEIDLDPLAQLSLRFFSHAAKWQRFYRAISRMSKESSTLLHTYAHRLLSDELRTYLGQLTPRSTQPTIPVEVAVAYLTSTLLALLTWWLDQDLLYTPEQMDAMFRKLALPGLAGAFVLSDEKSPKPER